MEEICRTCKHYWNGECHNQDFKQMVSGSSAEDEFVELTEDGVLAEYIRENKVEAYELTNIVLRRLNNLDYIKKNKKNIMTFRDIDDEEEFLNEFTETIDSMISSFVLPKLKDMEMEFAVDSEFGCRLWE